MKAIINVYLSKYDPGIFYHVGPFDSGEEATQFLKDNPIDNGEVAELVNPDEKRFTLIGE